MAGDYDLSLMSKFPSMRPKVLSGREVSAPSGSIWRQRQAPEL